MVKRSFQKNQLIFETSKNNNKKKFSLLMHRIVCQISNDFLHLPTNIISYFESCALTSGYTSKLNTYNN